MSKPDIYCLEHIPFVYKYDYEAAQSRNPSHVVFNGHQTILHDQPLKANAEDCVRLYFSNNGPSGTSSFHVIGAIFDLCLDRRTSL